MNAQNLQVFIKRRWLLIIIGAAVIVELCVLILPYTQSFMLNTKDIVDLSGEWSITLEDKSEFAKPEFDDTSWDQVTLPGSMISYAIKKKNKIDGICWLRKKIKLNSKEEIGRLGLILGRIGDADETYFNGSLVGSMGSFPPESFSMWNHPRNYNVPDTIVNYDGYNVIAVRISYYNYCEMLGKLAITDKNSMQKYAFASTFLNITTGYIAIAIGAVLFILSSLVYLTRPDYEEALFYSIPLLCGLPVVLETCSYWNIYPDVLFRYKILGFSSAALHASHSFFLHKLYKLDRGFIETLLKVYLGVILVICLLFATKENLRVHGALLMTVLLVNIIYNFTCSISALKNNCPYSKIFSFFGISFLLLVVNDSLLYISKFSSPAGEFLHYGPNMTLMTAQFGAVLLYSGVAMVMVSRFINMMNSVENLNNELEAYIVKNKSLSKELKDRKENNADEKITGVAISNQIKKKIDKIIIFINENYSSNITRNDLAEYVGIHPDSLGKNFKKYSGKKLSEYINELRIQETARRLRGEDTNVIDIAFDSGFESLRTFQRMFPKYMGTTPEKYRKKYQ